MKTSMFFLRSKVLMSSILFALLSLSMVMSPSAVGAAPTQKLATVPNHQSGLSLRTGGKSHLTQDPKWLAKKMSYGVRLTVDKKGHKTVSLVAANTAVPMVSVSYQLYTTYADIIHEPMYTGYDSASNYYTDEYMWNLCGPGASTISLDYWDKVNTRAFGTHSYSDGASTTTWDGSNERNYMMYLATQAYPPSFTSAGEEAYSSYPNATTYVTDLRDTLNWEASNHGSNWQQYFYAIIWSNNLNATILRNDIATDVYSVGIAPVVLVDDAYLPDWNSSAARGGSHYVAITGYDNNANTFTYNETCGPTSCGTSGYGHYTISQQQLLNGIVADGGALIW